MSNNIPVCYTTIIKNVHSETHIINNHCRRVATFSVFNRMLILNNRIFFCVSLWVHAGIGENETRVLHREKKWHHCFYFLNVRVKYTSTKNYNIPYVR